MYQLSMQFKKLLRYLPLLKHTFIIIVSIVQKAKHGLARYISGSKSLMRWQSNCQLGLQSLLKVCHLFQGLVHFQACSGGLCSLCTLGLKEIPAGPTPFTDCRIESSLSSWTCGHFCRTATGPSIAPDFPQRKQSKKERKGDIEREREQPTPYTVLRNCPSHGNPSWDGIDSKISNELTESNRQQLALEPVCCSHKRVQESREHLWHFIETSLRWRATAAAQLRAQDL